MKKQLDDALFGNKSVASKLKLYNFCCCIRVLLFIAITY